jgi:hypothetical protein
MESIMPFDDELDTTEKLTFSHEYVDVIIRQSLTGNARELEALPMTQSLEGLVNNIGLGRQAMGSRSAD